MALVCKDAPAVDRLFDLVPKLPAGRQVVRRISGSTPTCAISSVEASGFAPPPVPISSALFTLLADDAEQVSAAERCARAGLREGQIDGLATEMFDLWQERAIALVPPAHSNGRGGYRGG